MLRAARRLRTMLLIAREPCARPWPQSFETDRLRDAARDEVRARYDPITPRLRVDRDGFRASLRRIRFTSPVRAKLSTQVSSHMMKGPT